MAFLSLVFSFNGRYFAYLFPLWSTCAFARREGSTGMFLVKFEISGFGVKENMNDDKSGRGGGD